MFSAQLKSPFLNLYSSPYRIKRTPPSTTGKSPHHRLRLIFWFSPPQWKQQWSETSTTHQEKDKTDETHLVESSTEGEYKRKKLPWVMRREKKCAFFWEQEKTRMSEREKGVILGK